MNTHPLASRVICPDCSTPLGPFDEGRKGGCGRCGRSICNDDGIWDLMPRNHHFPWEAIEHRDLERFDAIAGLYEGLTGFAGARKVIAEWSLTKIDEVNLENCGKVARGKAVLEIGCGRGTLAASLTKLASAVAAMDISKGSLRYAQKLGNLSKDTLALHANISSIPFSDDTFDVVVISEVLEHLPGLEQAMCEIRRVVKPGGHVVASVPNALMFLYPLPLLLQLRRRKHRQWLAALLRREVDDNPTSYHRPFLPTTFRRLFVRHGFRVISHDTAMIYFWRWPYDRLILWADRHWSATERLVRLFIRTADFLLDHRCPILRWWGTRQFIVAQKTMTARAPRTV